MKEAIRRISAFLVVIIVSHSLSIAQISKGYHGLVEGDYSFDFYGSSVSINWKGLNTIHGYQATSNLFVGAGVGFHALEGFRSDYDNGDPMRLREKTTDIPVFVDFKFNFTKTRLSPYADLRLGQDITNDHGKYQTIGVGCRYAINDKSAINVTLAYSERGVNYEEFYPDVNSIGKIYYFSTSKEETLRNASIRISYEF